jgi:hypothetical protein
VGAIEDTLSGMRRDQWLRIRMSAEDRAILKRGAIARGRRISEHVRELLRQDEIRSRVESSQETCTT